jgi:pentapeptide repeat protein
VRLHLSTKKPVPWAERKTAVRHAWTTPFWMAEWCWEWAAYFLSNWMFLRVLDYVRGLGVIVAVIFYFAESGDRVKQRHYQAWQVINTAQGKGGNGGRIEALQELNADGVSLVGVNLESAFLQGLHIEKGHLTRSNFSSADARNAVLAFSDLSYASMQSTNLRECSCSGVSLEATDLNGADLSGTNLSNADLTAAILDNVDLQNADVRDTQWKKIKSLKQANIGGIRNAPDGFVEWALKNGAIQTLSNASPSKP